jgi:hypothetical protein
MRREGDHLDRNRQQSRRTMPFVQSSMLALRLCSDLPRAKRQCPRANTVRSSRPHCRAHARKLARARRVAAPRSKLRARSFRRSAADHTARVDRQAAPPTSCRAVWTSADRPSLQANTTITATAAEAASSPAVIVWPFAFPPRVRRRSTCAGLAFRYRMIFLPRHTRGGRTFFIFRRRGGKAKAADSSSAVSRGSHRQEPASGSRQTFEVARSRQKALRIGCRS